MKILCQQVVSRILKGEIDYDKVIKSTESSNFSTSDIKAGVAALHFIIMSSSKFQVDDAILASELMQLGLPKEHADATARVYRENKDSLVEKLESETLRINTVKNVEWRCDHVISSSHLVALNQPTVHLKLQGSSSSTAFELSADKFRVLLADLKEARKIMQSSSD